MKQQAPIGVFDSGVGGLSVLREIRRVLPAENLLYVADSDFAPYGDQPGHVIQQRAEAIVAFFVHTGVKAVVVACNTATAVAVQALRARFAFPIIAIEPAVKPAAALTKSGVIGILATSQTLASKRYLRLVGEYGKGVAIIAQPCPGLVEQVEKADLDGPETQALVDRYVSPLLERKADTLVLGCTHFPFLHAVIGAFAGPHVSLVDPACAVAREVQRRLKVHALLSREQQPGTERFWTSGAPDRVHPVMEKLWGREIEVCPLPSA